MKIASEMQIDIFHWNDLGIAATCGPALHPETRTKRWLTQTHHRLLANGIQPVS